jgi:DNA polymerase V
MFNRSGYADRDGSLRLRLIRHAGPALERIFRPGIRYAKCGVMLAELTPEGSGQDDLFDKRDRAHRRRLMNAIDAVNPRMGRDTAVYAACGLSRDWKLAATMKSPHFTTDWRQVMIVNAD